MTTEGTLLRNYADGGGAALSVHARHDDELIKCVCAICMECREGVGGLGEGVIKRRKKRRRKAVLPACPQLIALEQRSRVAVRCRQQTVL